MEPLNVALYILPGLSVANTKPVSAELLVLKIVLLLLFSSLRTNVPRKDTWLGTGIGSSSVKPTNSVYGAGLSANRLNAEN